MIKYEVIKDITLKISSRDKFFHKGEKITENLYTKNYPQYFKRCGEVKGYDTHLAKFIFVPDPETKKEDNVKFEPKEVELEELDDVKFETEE